MTMITKTYLMTLTPTPGLPQVKWKNYQLLSLERTRYLNQYEKIFFNQNCITKQFHLNRLSWIEKYGPTCPQRKGQDKNLRWTIYHFSSVIRPIDNALRLVYA